MNALGFGLSIFGEPALFVALIALAAIALQCERAWSRSRRRRGLEPGGLAYLLDSLVILSGLLAFVAGATLFVHGLKSIAMLIGGAIDGERVGLLIVGPALALGLALALARIAGSRRAAQPATSATMPLGYQASAAEAHLAGAPTAPVSEAPRDYLDEAPALAMLQEPWQPAAASAASVPTSFLDLAEPSSKSKPRFAFASTLLSLALLVLLVGGAVLFRHQLIDALSGMEPANGTANTALERPTAGAEIAAANVAAAAPAASAPTAASLPTPAAPLPASDAQGAQKRVKSNGLNLRAQPGLDQQVVLVLKQGDTVTVFTDARLIQGATWVRVRAGDNEGWVDQSLLE